MSEVYVTKTINTVKDDIYYLIKNGEISFFYKEFLLFKHNKNNPVISIILSKGGAEKEVPLINYDINKININKYEIEFYYQIYRIKINLALKDNVLSIKVKNSNKYYGVKVSVKNSVGKIAGFGLHKEEVSNTKEYFSPLFYGDSNNLYDDKILAFFKEKKYFLQVIGNYEWKTRLTSLIEMYFKKTKEITIKVFFCKELAQLKSYMPSFTNALFADKKLVVKTTTTTLDSTLYKHQKNQTVGTVILCDDHINFWQLRKLREQLKRRNISVMRKVQPKISEKDDYFNQFSSGDFIKASSGKLLVERGKENTFYFDLTNIDTCRKVKNYIRRILGTNIDGLLSVEKENMLVGHEIYKEIYKEISLRWQNILYEASLEYYTPKMLIFDNLTPSVNGYFLVDGNKLSRTRYKKQLRSLKYSGIFNTVIAWNNNKAFSRKSMKNKLQKEYAGIINQ